MKRPINMELFSCSGGMAEGFRRAGIEFDFVFDYDEDACASYEVNLGHRPVRMDVRDLVRLARGGWRPGPVALLVADPPCTPWSRAGKRLGTDDERDMLEETDELIAILKPAAYLIGNVPGLQDSTSWHVVQRVIGGLRKHGYCVKDYVQLDAADYGVPQHRVRPFWFGHLDGPCARWPAPTHGDASHPSLPGLELQPWVTCREALQHLPIEDLGRPVRLRRTKLEGHPNATPDGLAPTIRGGGSGHSAPQVVLADKRHVADVSVPRPNHPISRIDEPSFTIKCNGGRASQAASMLELPSRAPDERRPPESGDEPSRTITTKAFFNHLLSVVPSRKKRPPSTKGSQSSRTMPGDSPATTVCAREDRIGSGSPVLDWPWSRPSTTVTTRNAIPPPRSPPGVGQHPVAAQRGGAERARRRDPARLPGYVALLWHDEEGALGTARHGDAAGAGRSRSAVPPQSQSQPARSW